MNEIRDKQTKRNLAFLPYKLNFKEPFPEHVRFGERISSVTRTRVCESSVYADFCFIFSFTVTEFAKKTGDYPSLSATDIKVLALTYQLEVENGGAAHLKKEPAVQVLTSN